MPGIRDLLTVTLGVALGLALIVAPRTVLRVSVFVGPSRRRRGEYGTEDVVPGRWTQIARGLGLASVLFSAFIAYQVYA